MATEFTPLVSLFGGLLIGAGASLLLLGNGRIAGISGIISTLLPPVSFGRKAMEAALFVMGLLLAYPLYQMFAGTYPPVQINGSTMTLAAAGLLVGFGTVIGSGCTSGHGVCGMSRLSARSILATLTFMATGIITVFVLRHVVGG